MSRIARLGTAAGLFLFCVFQGKAQSPNWTVDYSRFQFRMTASVVLEREGTPLARGENKVAVFVGDEIRGVGRADAYHEPTDQYLAIFQIGSNQLEGEELNFRVYDERADEVISVRFTETFQADELIGSINDPMVLSDNQFPTAIIVSDTSFVENIAVGTNIATLTTVDGDDGDHTYALSAFDPEAASEFITLEANQLIVTDTVSFEVVPSFSVVVSAQDPFSAAISKKVEFRVEDQPETPQSILLSDERIAENNPLSAQVALMTVLDDDADETFTFSFAPVLENADSAYFRIDDNRLLAAKVFNYESKAFLDIYLTCTDKDGLSRTEAFTISVDDIEEPEPVSNYLSPNGDGFNDFLIIENAEIYPGFTLRVVNLQGKEVYRKTDYANDWDGYYQGRPLPAGVYHYTFKSESGDVNFSGRLYIKDR
ncbi:MAG: gliding motility-associated C-terminal domain-containing protein [Bacteroidota bacterium]